MLMIDASEYMQRCYKDISKESDRGAVILSASMIDQSLRLLLGGYFTLPEKKEDELFDTPYSPLGSFSAKIAMCYRLGLIDKKTKQQIMSLKSIRNDFAHSQGEATLASKKNESRLIGILDQRPEVTEIVDKITSDVFGLPKLEETPAKLSIERYGHRLMFDCLFSSLNTALQLKKVARVKAIRQKGAPTI